VAAPDRLRGDGACRRQRRDRRAGQRLRPTVLVRTDMDALPIKEQTGLPYASTTTTKNDAGETVSVMHACGHDIHMASWVGAATLLAGRRTVGAERWSSSATGRGSRQRCPGDGQGHDRPSEAGLRHRYSRHADPPRGPSRSGAGLRICQQRRGGHHLPGKGRAWCFSTPDH